MLLRRNVRPDYVQKEVSLTEGAHSHGNLCLHAWLRLFDTFPGIMTPLNEREGIPASFVIS